MAVIILYLGLAALLAFEEAGVFFLPGDITLVAAGVHARQGDSSLWVWWIAGSAAMVIGASVLYVMLRGTHRSRRVLPIRARVLIRRYGWLGVAAARLLPGLRSATVLGAASARLPYRQFVLGLIPAAMLWSGSLLLAGWLGGPAILDAVAAMDAIPGLKVLSVGLVLCGGLVVIWRLRVTAREAPSKA